MAQSANAAQREVPPQHGFCQLSTTTAHFTWKSLETMHQLSRNQVRQHCDHCLAVVRQANQTGGHDSGCKRNLLLLLLPTCLPSPGRPDQATTHMVLAPVPAGYHAHTLASKRLACRRPRQGCHRCQQQPQSLHGKPCLCMAHEQLEFVAAGETHAHQPPVSPQLPSRPYLHLLMRLYACDSTFMQVTSPCLASASGHPSGPEKAQSARLPACLPCHVHNCLPPIFYNMHT